MKRSSLWVLILGAASLATTACAGAYVVRYAPAPPPPRAMGYAGVAPGPGYVWIDGYWDWRGRNWNWVSGRWARAPYPHAVWVPGYWTPRGRGHVWIKGYWRR